MPSLNTGIQDKLKLEECVLAVIILAMIGMIALNIKMTKDLNQFQIDSRSDIPRSFSAS